MRQEFHRYRLESQRGLIGMLQLGSAAGLLAGLKYPWMGRSAAVGLALMMLSAVVVRIKIRDTLLQTMPAFAYMTLNAYLSWKGF